MISISMCMIVKNEQELLKRCLDSYSGTYDELIIIDTGSTDNTKETASHYTDKIYDYEWCDDFAAARNFAFSKAGCDYILSVDADEVLDTYNNQELRKLKSALLPEIDIVQMYYVNDTEYNSVYNAHKELRPKLFKRVRSFNWISPIHETIQVNPVIYDSGIEILHRPAASHSKRDFSIYLKAFDKGLKLQDYVVTMLCKELLISGEDSDFLAFRPVFEQLAYEERSLSTLDDINCILAHIYQIAGEEDKFFKIVLKCIANNPSSEIYLTLGRYYYNRSDYNEAAIWLYNAAFDAKSVLDISSSGNKALHLLSECYKHMSEQCLNDYERIQYLEMADDYEAQADSWTIPEM